MNHGDVHGSIDCFSDGWPDLANIRYPVHGATNVEETSITNVSSNSSRKRKADKSPRSKVNGILQVSIFTSHQVLNSRII